MDNAASGEAAIVLNQLHMKGGGAISLTGTPAGAITSAASFISRSWAQSIISTRVLIVISCILSLMICTSTNLLQFVTGNLQPASITGFLSLSLYILC
ncbi:hypothetical protein FKM82_010204 [Ascaphus truei]